MQANIRSGIRDISDGTIGTTSKATSFISDWKIKKDLSRSYMHRHLSPALDGFVGTF